MKVNFLFADTKLSTSTDASQVGKEQEKPVSPRLKSRAFTMIELINHLSLS